MGSWADHAIKKLQNGESVIIKPRGSSMKGRIESGNMVTLVPCDPYKLVPGDIVLVKVKGRIYLHLIKSLKNYKNKIKFQIGNNRGFINGWVGSESIYGIVSKIENG